MPTGICFFVLLVLHYERFGSGVEGHIQHGDQGNGIADDKHQIQREEITQHAVDHSRKSGAANGCGLDESHNSTPVFLRKHQHQGSVEYGIAGAIGDGSQRCPNTQRKKIGGSVG